jgi:hypothetical protein
MADLAVNDGLAQGTYSCGEEFVYGGVVGGLDSTGLQEGPQRTCHLQELSAGAHCAGTRRSLAALSAQRHHPQQTGLKGLADRLAALLQSGPVDRSVLVAVPVANSCCCRPSSSAPNSALAPRQPGIKLPTRVQQGRCSLRAAMSSELIRFATGLKLGTSNPYDNLKL